MRVDTVGGGPRTAAEGGGLPPVRCVGATEISTAAVDTAVTPRLPRIGSTDILVFLATTTTTYRAWRDI
jgi:hypothetical protein